MSYQNSKKYDDLKKINITGFYKNKHWFAVTVEILFLGQGEWTGYYNRIDAKLRIVSATVQTSWSLLFLGFIGHIIKSNSDQVSQINIVNVCGLIAALFGTTFFREMKDIHNKWDYLAKTFNDIVKLPLPADTKYSQRNHLSACLGHDILTMNMWGHRSFRSLFKELLEKAVVARHKGNDNEIIRVLDDIADNGISFEQADSLIIDYLESVRADTDRINLKSVA